MPMDQARLWLNHIKRLHALAETGLAFSTDEFDIERYEEMSYIAQQMMADIANSPPEIINDLVTPFHRRYVTPQVEVRGAVIRDGKILLVQEKSDNKWTLPGGYADVGLSAVQNMVKEIQEEANLNVGTCQLISMRHKAAGDYDPDLREFYKLFFLCSVDDQQMPKPGMETCGAEFFSMSQLPDLSTGRTILRDIQDALNFASGTRTQTIIE